MDSLYGVLSGFGVNDCGGNQPHVLESIIRTLPIRLLILNQYLYNSLNCGGAVKSLKFTILMSHKQGNARLSTGGSTSRVATRL